MTHLWFAAGLVVLQAFFVTAEAALLEVDREALATAPGGGAARARWFLEKPSLRLLPTTLVGTHTSVLAGALLVAHYAQEQAGWHQALFFFGAAAVLIVLGRAVPRALGEEHATRLSCALSRPLWVAEVGFRPIVFVLATAVGSMLRALRLSRRPHAPSREEIEEVLNAPGVAAPAGTSGALTEPERRMIARIFEFGERTVYDIMVPLSEVSAIPEDSPLAEAVAEYRDKRHTRMPIYRERVDQVVGILHAFDVLKASKDATVAELARAPVFVPESQPVVDTLALMQQRGESLVVVVDEYGGAVGVVSGEDIVEEIVGEIEDELDAAAPSSIRQEGPGVWRVAGRTPIAEINRVLRVELPEGDGYESVAGLLLDRMLRIPRENESVQIEGVTITVTGASERAVEDVRIRVRR